MTEPLQIASQHGASQHDKVQFASVGLRRDQTASVKLRKRVASGNPDQAAATAQ